MKTTLFKLHKTGVKTKLLLDMFILMEVVSWKIRSKKRNNNLNLEQTQWEVILKKKKYIAMHSSEDLILDQTSKE